MANCAECSVKMGYTESNVARDHEGMCVACYVKSLVKTKVEVANTSRRPSNVKSLDNYFEKFENILVTSELSTNLRVRKRFGVVHGEATLTGSPHKKEISWKKILLRKPVPQNHQSLRKAIQEADIELKANAIRKGANTILGYSMHLTDAYLDKKNYVIVSVSGTAVETA
ncbi:MAG: heavy metal-binding domain-containing protein [Paracoccaceae bacterium]|jgi:uncharacterized protein YbjQ (UPF0145 family)